MLISFICSTYFQHNSRKLYHKNRYKKRRCGNIIICISANMNGRLPPYIRIMIPSLSLTRAMNSNPYLSYREVCSVIRYIKSTPFYSYPLKRILSRSFRYRAPEAFFHKKSAYMGVRSFLSWKSFSMTPAPRLCGPLPPPDTTVAQLSFLQGCFNALKIFFRRDTPFVAEPFRGFFFDFRLFIYTYDFIFRSHLHSHRPLAR